MTEGEVFVISRSDTVHRQSCHTVELFTRGFQTWRHHRDDLDVTEDHPIGWEPPPPEREYDDWSIVGEKKYVTADDLAHRRYIRCRVCAPDLPEYRRKNVRAEVRVQGLRPHHIGRHFEGLGSLTKVAFDKDGYAVTVGGRVLRLDADDVITYRRG